MALEEDLATQLRNDPAVAAIVGTKVSWGMTGGSFDAGQAQLPALVLHLIDGVPDVTQTTQGTALTRARVQVDCLSATSMTQARQMVEAVKWAVLGRRGLPFSCVGAVVRDAHDAAARRYRRMVDLDIWHTA